MLSKRSLMRFDIHLRQTVRQRLGQISSQMALWDGRSSQSADLHPLLVNAIQPFSHTTRTCDLLVGGVDGSGEFPILAYGDSFVYTTVAAATLYRADPVHGLREVDTGVDPLVEFTWLS